MARRDPHQPDFDQFLRSLLRRDEPSPVPIAEFLIDWPIIEAITGHTLPVPPGEGGLTQATIHRAGEPDWVKRFVDAMLEFSLWIGMDYLYIELDTGLQLAEAKEVGGTEIEQERNWWYVSPTGRVANWEDFERFPWPSRDDLDYSMLDYACHVVPEGMKIMVQTLGLFEPLYCLMGLETLSFVLYDEPDLVNEFVSQVIDLLMAQVEVAMQHEQVGGVWMGDDLGYNSGPFVSPSILREVIFPGYQQLIDLTHRHGRVFFLHSCGNLRAIMEDLIRLGIDAKHSFEDKIQPVEEVYRQWGERIALIGGVDMDILARGTQEQVCCRTREILDVCGPDGGYALGSGNSVTDYIPTANYLAMLDVGRQWNKEHFGS
jgi:uroporphyrinogen decarboxylase